MPQGYLPLLMFLAGVTIVAWVLLRRGLMRGRRRTTFDARPIDAQERPTSTWSGAHTDASAILERQQVELAEFRREVMGQIDTKILVLRELMRQSDEQIQRMEQLLVQAEQDIARR